jgi:hypothetical protein
MKTNNALSAEMDRVEGLLNLELGDRFWTLILESSDRKSSGILSPSIRDKQVLIHILKDAIRLLEDESNGFKI